MKILLLANHLNTGGISSYLMNLSRALTGKGHKVWIASAGGNCVPLLHPQVRHARFDIRVKLEVHPKVWLSLPRLVRFVKGEGFDIIHANTRVTQIMAQLSGQVTGTPFISTCHGFFKPRLFRRLFPGWGRAVIAISRPVEKHLIEDFHLDKSRVHWIANGIDVNGFPRLSEPERRRRKEQWRAQGGPHVGIVARLSKVKGINTLIEIFPQVRAQFPGARLWIVGQGPEEEHLKQLALSRGLAEAVRFESIVNHTGDILPVFDVFVMPSVQEGLGLSVMEAQAAGVPVAAFAVGGLPDLITDGKTGFLAPAGDAGALALKILELLRQPAKAAAMAGSARRQVEEKFSAEHMADKTIAVYEKNSGR